MQQQVNVDHFANHNIYQDAQGNHYAQDHDGIWKQINPGMVFMMPACTTRLGRRTWTGQVIMAAGE